MLFGFVPDIVLTALFHAECASADGHPLGNLTYERPVKQQAMHPAWPPPPHNAKNGAAIPT